MKPLQISPENAGKRISNALKLKIFRGSMPPRGYRLRRAVIRTPLRQILDPPQVIVQFKTRSVASIIPHEALMLPKRWKGYEN